MPTRRAAIHTIEGLSQGDSIGIDALLHTAFALIGLHSTAACRVRLYTTNEARAADAARQPGTLPEPGSGVILDYVTPGAGDYPVTPPAIGASLAALPTDQIPAIITHLGASTTFDVGFHFLPLEG